MNTNNTALNLAVTEINQMLNNLSNAKSLEEFSMIANFLHGFSYGQFKQGILTQDEHERLCSMVDVNDVNKAYATFEVKRDSNVPFINISFTQHIWNVSVPCSNQIQSVTHYKC